MTRMKILVCCLVAALATSAQTYTESFEAGIPSSFKIYDLDGLDLNQSMKGLGFKDGKGWISYSLKDEQGSFAVSTSKYENPGTSNDWLVTPEIEIRSEGIWLEWKGISCSKTSKAGYKIMVSQKGAESTNFTGEPIFEIAEEEISWTTRHVSLDRYQGKKIHLAFVNNSTDKYLLGIDDIKVRKPERISKLSTAAPSSVSGVQEFTVSGKINANYSKAISSFTASYNSGGKTRTQEFSGLDIRPGEEYVFSFDEKLPVEPGDTVRYAISVSIDGETYEAEGSTVCYTFLPMRSFVLEEGTGTWCGYCPAGHVALDYMRHTYPNDVITIAVHNEDPMTVKIYDSGLYSLGIDGYPIGFINRKYKSQPMGRDMTPANGGWETTYLNAKEELAPAALDLSVEYTDNEQSEVKFHTKAKFALNLPEAQYSIAYVVKECNVKGTTVKYNQNNSYSGSDKSVGGFEKLPISIPASIMVYHDVARSVKPSFKGDLWINKAIKADDEISCDYVLALPSTILNKENVSFIALLLDTRTGEIVNAKSFGFSQHEHEGLATAIENQTLDDMAKIRTYPDGDQLSVSVKLKSASAISVGIYDLNGRHLTETAIDNVLIEHQFTLPIAKQNGVYLLKVTAGQEVYFKKFVL